MISESIAKEPLCWYPISRCALFPKEFHARIKEKAGAVHQVAAPEFAGLLPKAVDPFEARVAHPFRAAGNGAGHKGEGGGAVCRTRNEFDITIDICQPISH